MRKASTLDRVGPIVFGQVSSWDSQWDYGIVITRQGIKKLQNFSCE